MTTRKVEAPQLTPEELRNANTGDAATTPEQLLSGDELEERVAPLAFSEIPISKPIDTSSGTLNK